MRRSPGHAPAGVKRVDVRALPVSRRLVRDGLPDGAERREQAVDATRLRKPLACPQEIERDQRVQPRQRQVVPDARRRPSPNRHGHVEVDRPSEDDLASPQSRRASGQRNFDGEREPRIAVDVVRRERDRHRPEEGRLHDIDLQAFEFGRRSGGEDVDQDPSRSALAGRLEHADDGVRGDLTTDEDRTASTPSGRLEGLAQSERAVERALGERSIDGELPGPRIDGNRRTREQLVPAQSPRSWHALTLDRFSGRDYPSVQRPSNEASAGARGAQSSATKPTRRWLLSQNGFVRD